MIIDAHAHMLPPDKLMVFKTHLQGNGGSHGFQRPALPDADVKAAVDLNLAVMDGVGTDVQLISPRPFQMMHSQRPDKVVHNWTVVVNDVIAQMAALAPSRLAGIAGLPQAWGQETTAWVAELERCVTELGMVGCVLNPDPAEGLGTPPPLGDRFWYPVYEKLCELDVPAQIHSTSCNNGRESYSGHFITEESIAVLSLLDSRVFDDFPTLKIFVSHGGGSIPYQIGRYRAAYSHPAFAADDKPAGSFDERLARLWFDTVLHEPEPLELLIKTVGAQRCVFGTERPGSGTTRNPRTGYDYDDIKQTIDGFGWLGDDERAAIYEGNARALFPRLSL